MTTTPVMTTERDDNKAVETVKDHEGTYPIIK